MFEQSPVQTLLLTFEILNFVEGNVTKLYTNFTFSFLTFGGLRPHPDLLPGLYP